MSEEKEKRVASFGMEIIQYGTETFCFRVFDKEGTIVESVGLLSEENCRNQLARLRKVCKNRYTSTKMVQK